MIAVGDVRSDVGRLESVPGLVPRDEASALGWTRHSVGSCRFHRIAGLRQVASLGFAL